MDECIFCKIVNNEAPSYKIWEDDEFLAILSIYPNTEGFTVVLPKKHYTSYAFELDDDILLKLVLASKKVAKILDNAFEDVGRTGLFLEGFGVNHLHSKLFPMHGTNHLIKDWKPVKSDINTYFEEYRGYISSHDSERISDDELKKIALKIKNSIKSDQ
ncbi:MULTISPECIES: HIT family protein [Acinetobacter]|uniref:HIT family protein n=1 Tax=Acinetobacter TaxID=469 RepID=UPI001907636C|nr:MULTISPECIES: HIT family protein [Acinetobacter]MBJ9373724.1 HIT family protein [Acinetobacter sp. TGL-Y2]MDV8157474.1 HIT family protein [Acinetobacter bereziniae]